MTNYSLPDVIIILFSAIFVIVLFKKLRLSPVIGYIVAGAIIGPYGLDLAGYNDATKSLAEFGVVFLLFAVGLELSLERLIAMRHYIFGLGSLQFILTSAVLTFFIDLYLNNFLVSLVIGSSLSLSSTAIIFKMLSEEKSSNTLSGKISISVLLLQDLLVVPLFILVPVIGQGDINYFNLASSIILKSILALTIIIAAGRFLLRPVMSLILSAKYNDLFIAATILIILCASWVTEELGLSLGLGAFMAGVMIAETEFRPQIENTINQFKGLFLGFFFMTEIGMHFDFSIIAEYFHIVLLSAFFFILLKAAIFFVICYKFRIKKGTAINSALMLAQGSEFAFVLFELSRGSDLITNSQFQILSLIVGVSMAVAPMLANLGRYLEQKLYQETHRKQNPNDIPTLSDHVVIAGFGRVGEIVSQILEKNNIPYLAIDSDLEQVSKFYKQKKPVFYGDIGHDVILENLHIQEARAVVLAINNVDTINKTVKSITKKYPDIPLVVRADDIKHYKHLRKIGAKMIIPEIYELGIQISSQILKLSGAQANEIKESNEEFRRKFLKS